jgi:predicted DNA-binding ribbon-helix-helix protein
MIGSARIVKRSLEVAGHRTSVSLEDAFWRRLKAIATVRRVSVNRLAAEVDAARGEANLSSALRVFVLETVAPNLNRWDSGQDIQLLLPDRKS